MSKRCKNSPIIDTTDFMDEHGLSACVYQVSGISKRRSEELVNMLEDFYLFRNPEEVKVFLLGNDYLIEILFEAHWQIKRIFGGGVTIYIELHRDPEEEFEELFVVVKSTYSPEEARKLMDQLDEKWFLDVINKTQGNMCITEVPL